MKKMLLSTVALIISSVTYGQLSGVYYIPAGPSGSPTFPSISDAITALNNQGVGGTGVTFNVNAGYTESTINPLLVTATGTVGTPVIFRKDPSTIGPNPLVTRTDAGSLETNAIGAQGDAVILIQGSDYTSFDGIDVSAIAPGIEYGYYLRKTSVDDGCKYDTIKNATITMTKGSSQFVVGIYSSNNDATSSVTSATGITVASTGGRNEHLVFTGNTVQNVFAGIVLRGYNHSTSPYDFQDQNNTVGQEGAGNTIRNYAGNFAAASWGVYMIYQTSPNVSFNMINNALGGSNATSTLYGIFMSVSNAAGDFVAIGNNITLGQGATSAAHCIYNGQTGNSVNISDNKFSYGTFASTTNTYIINCGSNGSNTFIISGNSTQGSINKTGAGGFVCYWGSGTGPTGGTATIENNNFSNITMTGNGSFYGIYHTAAAGFAQTVAVTHNTISNITGGGTSAMYGIVQGGGAAGSTVNLNVVSNLNGTSSGTVAGMWIGQGSSAVTLDVHHNTITGLTGSTGSVYGLYNNSGTTNNIFQNSIYNLRSNSTGSPPVYGIHIPTGTLMNVYNNYISDLKAPLANAAIPVAGINVLGGTTVNLFCNTIYLNATYQGSGLFGTAGINASTTPSLDIRNNVIVNKSDRAGNGGYTVAYRRSTATLGSYALTSDRNDFYVLSSSPAFNYIYYDGTAGMAGKDSSMSAYQTRVTPRDAASFSEMPPFVNTMILPYDLHISSSVLTQCESGATRITSPFAVTVDWDSDFRWGEPGYVGTGTAPDVGADEFSGMNPFQPMITGIVTNPQGQPPLPANLFIIATPHCDPAVTQTTANGGITYQIVDGVGRYSIFPFPGYPYQPGDIVDVSFFDGVSFRPLQVIVTGQLPVVANVQIVGNVFVPLQKTDWFTVAIPPNKTLLIHWNNVQWPYDGTGGCGNTDVQQWNGTSWYVPPYSPWNFNPDSTVREITNTTPGYIFKRFHCDDGYGFTLDFTLVPSTGQTSPANPQDFAMLNLGGRDGFACEFGNIIAPVHPFIYQPGSLLDNFPQRLGSDGVQNLEIQFESYDNIFWGDMELMVDLVSVTQPGTLELQIPDATVPSTSVPITPGNSVVHLFPGGILTPGLHTMTLSAQGGLSMGIDCFNFTSRVPAAVLPSVITTPVNTITHNSAWGGGVVTSDGGAPVTSRGVCWSMLPNPTILDFHTIDGTGLGPYVSFMAPLMPSTTYHVRAYATNLAGTAYGEELVFPTLPEPFVITGTITDSLGMSPPPEQMYIVAHTACNPNDSLSTLNGGITYSGGGGGGGAYTVHCSNFINPPLPGQQVFISFYNPVTQEFAPEMVEVLPGPITVFNTTIRLARHVHLPFRTAFVRVIIPPHRTLQIHYTFVNGCGNTDVFEWDAAHWTKFRQWNWNHYCTWRFIENNTNKPRTYVIHNDNGDIWFDMMFNCPVNPGTTPSNYNAFALFNMGWRDRPYSSCEFGTIVQPVWSFFDIEYAPLDLFPSRLGPDGVQELTIQFESYDNIFWSDMNLMIDLDNVTQPGILELHIPDATVPFTMAAINPGDLSCSFSPGGILAPGIHTMTLRAMGGLSMGIDCFNYTTMVPIPDLPMVTTAPITSIGPNSAHGGGEVTSEGGAAVTARGVCWSTSPNPTILDSHTTDGSGPGSYTSLISPLLPSTLYHVRAYATNLAGTAYGDELEFTTHVFVPDHRYVQNVTVHEGPPECYDAIYTITVAGDNTYLTVEPLARAIFVAGLRIDFLPHTWVMPGGEMHAYIDQESPYCPEIIIPGSPVMTGDEVAMSSEHSGFRIYPNPTTGDFTLEQYNDKPCSNARVEICSMSGEKMISTDLDGKKTHLFKTAALPAGLYFVRVVCDEYTETVKLIKAR